MVPPGTPVVNALFKQREAIVNVMRACIGLSPENYMALENRLATATGVIADVTAGAGAGSVVAVRKTARIAPRAEEEGKVEATA